VVASIVVTTRIPDQPEMGQSHIEPATV
jgi:hypothetical protein